MNSKIMRIIAWIYTVLGVIGSFVSGAKLEDIFYRLDASAAIVTIIGIIGTLFSASILFAIAKLLERAEYCTDSTASIKLMLERVCASAAPKGASNSKMSLSDIASKSTGGEWRCPKCGKTNPSTSRVCKDCAYEK
ncbi:MAG: hypothetical protein J6C96_12675 [Oscillospiraceae bacterium]|nr:hypothetical protein [Oscillospiraceae bacterium]